MPKQSTEHLVQLVCRLTKGEKRFFKLYVTKNQAVDELLFLKVFEYIDKYKHLDETKLLAKNKRIKKSQLSNLKAHLYKKILASLRQQHRHHYLDISLRESLDHAKMLYAKGMYKASLNILDKAKKSALKNNLYTDALTIIDFEKHIESQHITGSMYPKAQQITEETNSVLQRISLRTRLSDLSLSLYGLYLERGHVKDEKDYEFIFDYFNTRLPKHDLESMDFYERMYLYQSYVWLYYMGQDFVRFYMYAQRWVDLFEEFPEMIEKETPLFLKGIHNVLTAYFMAQRLDKFEPIFRIVQSLRNDDRINFTKNEEYLYNLFLNIHNINHIFLTAEYESGAKRMKVLSNIIDENTYEWDLNRIMNFNYKIGCVYFGAGDIDNAINFLNKITNQVIPNFREDIQCYARILNLIAHFELGNDLLVSYQIKSTYRFLLKAKENSKVLDEIFSFLRKTPRMLESELKSEFEALKEKLEEIEKEKYERRPFLYLDIISWLDSKIHNRSMAESIRLCKGISETDRLELLAV
jgi:hypothetical protein